MFEAAVQARKQRWSEFLDLDSPRRLVFLVRYAPDLPPRPLPNPDQQAALLEWIWQNYEAHQERMAWLDDDSLPYLDMLTGTELFAEAFGSPVHRPADSNPFALPCVRSAAEASRLRTPSLDVPPLARVFAMADQLAQRAGPGALFRLVDLQSPVDVAALIWEKTDFYPALIETPDAVEELIEKIKRLQFAFLDEWFRRYGRECIAHYPDYYMPQGASLSVDEIGAISGKMFLKYFLPDLNEFAARYGGLGVHCCAHARHQWDHFKKIEGLRLLNICGQEDTVREAYAYFAASAPVWHVDLSPQPRPPLDWLPEIPAGAHAVLEIFADTRAEAVQTAETLRSLYG